MQMQSAVTEHPLFREPDQLLSSLFNSPVVGVCTIDRRMQFEAVNEALAVINGVAARSHIGTDLRSILGDFTDRILPSMEGVFSTGKSTSFEVSGKLPSRPDIGHWIENYFPISHAGRVTHIGVVVVEITEQRKLEQALSRVSRRVDDLEAMVARYARVGARREFGPLTEDLLLIAEHIPSEPAAEEVQTPGRIRSLEEVERDYITRVLAATEGRISGRDGAAAKLGLKRTTLQSRMQKLGIHRSDFRTQPEIGR